VWGEKVKKAVLYKIDVAYPYRFTIMNLVNIFNLFFQLHRMHGLKKAFTLLEVIIALTLFEFVMIGVIMAVNRAYAYVQSTKFQVMAVNLAREGVEQMYTIRDTNRRKHSAQKDMYRLLPDPMVATNSSYDATTAVIASGVYTLDVKVSSGQQYPVLSGKALIP
jgi:Tfp pilus assembly protein PilV